MTLQIEQETSFAELYAAVAQFYARHMYQLDSGAAEDWVAGFTEDGVFAPPSAPEPIRGREQLLAGVRAARAKLAEAQEQHRHTMLNLDIRPQDDGTIAVRAYTQIIATPRGGEPRLHLMCVSHDVLVREAGELLIKHRRVTRDDRP
ncbi:nuclear transport factor 2 family protein [Nocardia pseudobrasiliensis]|uniref:Actinorhodin biosynthesis protein ActVIA n=1 Tax=Nocardia pseudobrasiliensis TaxID=45979 RepID=A0A370HKG7_9NOCA|nr:nuclear transport factor 2 family protein [Nocardia pseudobrasiliensis]RDI58999.1 actinorhodin biosynthesis protein ActVIA [Nocardia pseudobrasiliensis]